MPAVNDFETEEPAVIETPQPAPVQPQAPATSNGTSEPAQASLPVVSLDNGRITLINADCRTAMRSIKTGVIDLVCADPPYYGVVADAWDNQWKTLDDHLNWSQQWINECIRILKSSGSFYVWGSIGEKSDTIIHLKLLCDRLGLHFKDWITWKKSRGMGNRKGYLYAREEVLWYVKDNKQFIWNETYQYNEEPNQFKVGFSGYAVKSEFKRIPSIWTDIPERLTRTGDKSGKRHYTPKPHKAIQRIIQLHTHNLDQVVLDPFLGSGTTGEVCAKLGLRFIGIEKDTDNFKEAVHFIKRAISDRNITR